jgi:hypothetical protein
LVAHGVGAHVDTILTHDGKFVCRELVQRCELSRV